MPLNAGRFYEFGPFRLSADERLLFRENERVELAPKVLDTLILLVENHPRLVTKDELIRRLWPETFVEEGNLTFNVSTLRKVLGDDRNNGNRFIETVPKRGYRFIATVTVAEPELVTPEPEPAAQAAGLSVSRDTAPRRSPLAKNGLRLALPAIALAGLGFWIYRITHPLPPPRVLASKPLTQKGGQKGLSVVTDGLRLYFNEVSPGGDLLDSVSSTGGAIEHLATSWGDPDLVDIFPDRHQLLVRAEGSAWRLPLPVGSPQEWQGLSGMTSAGWSQDGKFLAFSEDKSLYRANADASERRKLTDAPGGIEYPRWSPDDKVVRFTVTSPEDKRKSLWEVRADGTNPHRVFPDWPAEHEQFCGNWTPDGRYFFFVGKLDLPNSGDTQIWAMREQPSLWHTTTHQPVQITHDGRSYYAPASSPDGRQIFAAGTENNGELLRYDLKAAGFLQFLNGLSATWVSFSKDGQKIAYSKYPEFTLWLAGADGGDARQLTFDPLVADGVAFAPDGKQVAFRTRMRGKKPSKIRLISIDGEIQGHELLPGREVDEGVPAWSPDGRNIAFGDVPPAQGRDDGTHTIHIFDLQTHSRTSLVGSKGLWSPRWSPDGRYMAALTIPNPEKLEIYEFSTGKWRDTGVGPIDNPTWSHDSKYVYYDTPGAVTENSGIYRVRISDGKPERVAGFGSIRRAAWWWSGLTPKDEPLILRDLGTSEIYALDVDWP
jgi:Tol biopolymer transport system component/DNA-binding winged helix-turn-helix (wHTH) protein